MKKHLLLTAALGLTAAAVILTTTSAYAASATVKISSQFHIVTAPTSPNNAQCLQNAYDDTERQITGIGGYIDVSTRPTSPTTVYRPGVLRGSELNYGPVSLKMYDSTNNPSGSFTNENGTRVCWIGAAEDRTNAFLASDFYFASSSSDSANTLGYTGNTATNTSNGLPLAFSPTLRGQVLDVNGNVLATYKNGETIAGRPINRLICSVRVAYFANNMSEVALNLNYFKNHMLFFTNTFALYAKDGSGNVVAGNTNHISSQVHCRPEVQASLALGKAIVDIEGQRQLGLGYLLWRKSPLDSTNAWQVIGSAGPEGYFTDTNYLAEAYYKASEGPTMAVTSLAMHFDPKFVPSVQVYNDIE